MVGFLRVSAEEEVNVGREDVGHPSRGGELANHAAWLLRVNKNPNRRPRTNLMSLYLLGAPSLAPLSNPLLEGELVVGSAVDDGPLVGIPLREVRVAVVVAWNPTEYHPVDDRLE